MIRRKLALIGLLAALPIIGWTVTVQASDGSSDGNFTVSEGQVVDGPLFASGQQINMGGEINGDMFCAGQNVAITGRVDGDVLCAAQNITVSGTVTGDVRSLSQTTAISGTVEGSVSAAAQTVNLQGGSRVGRDVAAAATSVTAAGAIGRDLWVAADSLNVEGQVARNVDARADRLALKGDGRVNGNFRYESRNELQRDQSAQIAGRVDRSQPAAERKDGFDGRDIVASLLFLLAMLATSLVLVLLVPAVFRRASDLALGHLGRTALIGFLATIVVPVLIITLMVTVIGLPLGLLLLMVWLVMLLLAGPFAAYLTGRLLLRDNQNALLIMMAGSAIILVLYLVPVLNFLIFLVVLWFGLGSMLYTLWQLRRRTSGEAAVEVEAGHDEAPVSTGQDRSQAGVKEDGAAEAGKASASSRTRKGAGSEPKP